MSRLKAFGSMLAWLVAVVVLYGLETYHSPEAAHWHMLSWQTFALGFINAVIVNGVIGTWKRLRKGDA